MKFKKGIHPSQSVLIPKKAADFLPENHLAKIIYTIVDKLSFSAIVKKYSKIGQHAYDPKMMIRLLFYHYAIGIYSSRKISNSCFERLDSKFLANGLTPSHDRISDFRMENLNEINQFFVDIVLIGNELGLIGKNMKVSIDGTKMKANASPKVSKTEEDFGKLKKKIEKEVSDLLNEAEEIDRIENELYKEQDKKMKKINSKKSRIDAIEEAMKKIKQKKELEKHKISRTKGRDPNQTEQKKIDQIKVNSTDNDSPFMKQRNGVIRPSYNCQTSVDEENQFILANDVVTECNDQHELIPMVEKTIKNTGIIPKKVKADNGYSGQQSIASRLYPKIIFYVDNRNRRKDNIDFFELSKRYDKEQMENLVNLLSERGAEEYKKRMYTVEPVYGNMKKNTRIKTFLLRGILKTKGEFNLMCIGHNLKKIAKFINKNCIDIATAMQNFQKKQRNMEKIREIYEILQQNMRKNILCC